MKNFIKGVLILAGVVIVVGTVGSLEQDMISVSRAALKMLNGGIVAFGGWLFGEVAEVYSVLKKGRIRREKTRNIIEFRSVA